MVGKMGGDSMAHMNTSSAGVEPALYYPGQKRPGEDGGEDLLFFFFPLTRGGEKAAFRIFHILFKFYFKLVPKPAIFHVDCGLFWVFFCHVSLFLLHQT